MKGLRKMIRVFEKTSYWNNGEKSYINTVIINNDDITVYEKRMYDDKTYIITHLLKQI